MLKEDFSGLRKMATHQQLASYAIEILKRISQDGAYPVAIVCGPITTGGRNPFYNYNRLKQAIALKKAKRDDVKIFNHLPCYWRAIEFQRQENETVHVPVIAGLHAPTGVHLDHYHTVRANDVAMKRREEMRREFLLPLLESGFIKIIYLLSGWRDSIDTCWCVQTGKSLGIKSESLPEDFA